MTGGWRFGFALLACVLWPCFGRAAAQTVSPAVTEYTGAAEGSCDIANEGVVAIVATVEPRSFIIDDEGTATFRKLDATTHVELSQTSVRVPPKQRRTIYYRAYADSYPAWFTVYSNLSGLPRRNGMNVVLSLPHTVYLLSKRPALKSDLRFTDVAVEGTTVKALLHNDGTEIVRVLRVDAMHGRSATAVGGFPLLPHGRRAVQIEVPYESRVTRLRARTERLTAEQALP